MTRKYVCGICGRSVATFESWADVEPSEIIELLSEELCGHNVNTTDMDGVQVLSRFHIVDDDDTGPVAGKPPDQNRAGQ